MLRISYITRTFRTYEMAAIPNRFVGYRLIISKSCKQALVCSKGSINVYEAPSYAVRGCFNYMHAHTRSNDGYRAPPCGLRRFGVWLSRTVVSLSCRSINRPKVYYTLVFSAVSITIRFQVAQPARSFTKFPSIAPKKRKDALNTIHILKTRSSFAST